MISKRSWIGILVVVNVLLLTALLMPMISLPSVLAQAGGRRGGYVCVTAKGPGQTYDILYLLDTSRGQLHALYPSPSGQLTHAATRDLRKDFARN